MVLGFRNYSKKFYKKLEKFTSFFLILSFVFSYSYSLIPLPEKYLPEVREAEAATTAIRQEINIIDGYFGSASGSYATSSGIANLDSSKYTGATYYFEVIASTSAATNATIKLRNATSSAEYASVTVNRGNSYQLYRSAAFTVPTGAPDLVVVTGNEAIFKGIKAARVIILQSADPIATTQTQIEIGNQETGKSNTSTSALTDPKYWTYDEDKWDGTLTAYAEVTFQNTQVSSSTVFTTATTTDTTRSVATVNGISYITVEAWGAGGGGSIGNAGGGGGGGGAYAKSIFATTSGSTNTLFIPQGGATDTAASAGDATFNITQVVADGGTGTNANTAGTGGTVANSTGQVEFAGGNGGVGHTTGDVGGGGGGAGGPNGAGVAAASATADTPTAGGNGNNNSGGAGGAAGTGTTCPSATGKPGVNNVLGGGGGGGADAAGTGACPGGQGGYPGGGGGSSEFVNTTQPGGAGQIKITETHGAVGFALEEDNGAFGGWTFKTMIATTTRGVATSTSARVRSDSFTPVDGRHYRIVASTTNASATYDVYNAKIIINQNTDSVNTYYFDASGNTVPGTPDDPNAHWTSDANAFDGNTATKATSLADAGSASVNFLHGKKTTSPTSNDSVTQVRARAYGYTPGSVLEAHIYTSGLAEDLGTITINTGVSSYTSYTTLTTPTGGWTLSKVNTLETKIWQLGAAGTNEVARIEVEVTTSGTITKLEPQYLLANTTLGSGTSAQNFISWWRPSEWSGVSNTYLHAVDTDDGSTSVVAAIATSSGSTITNSSITLSASYDQHATSTSALTMPGSDDGLDVKYTTDLNGVNGSRILVQVSQATIIGGTVYQTEGGSVATSKTINIYKNGSTLIGTAVTNGSGVYSATLTASITSGDILTAYIDGDTIDGVTVFVSNGTSQSDVHIYGGTLSVRQDTGSGITNANLTTGYVSGDATDMVYTTDGSNNLTVSSNVELHVWTGDTYTPGATVTTQGTGDLHVDDSATVTLGNSTNTIGDDINVDTGATLNINANTTIAGDLASSGTGSITYTSGTPTVTMSGTGSLGGGSGTHSFYNLTVSGTVTGSQSFTLNNTLNVSGGSLVLSGGTATLATTGWTVTNTGTLTFSALTISETPTVQPSSSFSVSGALTVNASKTLAPTAGTITMTGGSIVDSGTLEFYNLTINGNVTTSSAFDVTNNLNSVSGSFTISNSGAPINIIGNVTLGGTIDGTGNMSVYGGSVTGNGTINLTGGDFRLDGTGSFGGNTGWTFNRLTFGDGTGVATTTSTGTGSVTSATTTIAYNQILDAGVSKTWNLTASHEPFQMLGTFLASSSLVSYQGSNNATVTPTTYYNLDISPSSGSPTVRLATTTGQTITVNNNFTIAGSGNATVDANTRDPIIDVNGNFSIGASDVFQASNSAAFSVAGNFTNNGTFTHNNGTLTLDTTAWTTLTSSASMTFYNLSVTTPSKVLRFEAHGGDSVPIFGFDNQFTVTGGSGSPSNLIKIQSNTAGAQWLADFNVAQTAITYADIRDSGCAAGSLGVVFSYFNSAGGNNGSCWNIGNIGADGTTVEQASGGGTLRTGGAQSNGAVAIDGYGESNHSANYSMPAGATANAQSFTAVGGTLDSAKFYLGKAGSPTGNATAKLYAHSGTFGTNSVPTGAALATSDNFDVSTLSVSSQLITLSFSGANRITLNNGTKYVISFEYSGGGGGVDFGTDISSPTHSGNASYSTGGAFSALSDDLIFYVYIVPSDPGTEGGSGGGSQQGGGGQGGGGGGASP